LLSLEEIALSKAKQAYRKFGVPLIAEDTGIYFTALKNFPGSKSKRIFEEIGYKGLMEKLKGKKRNALFKTVICFIWKKEEYKLFEGKLEGRITEKPEFLNKDVLPYERIFIPKGKKKLMAELSRKEKNKFSHRAIAAGRLGEFLKTKKPE
ncbi:non-canonical purine NTP pyrophosphatase, partial [Candidatus Micrarchaeota archaeon]|nr:non-canonical purine NTP pyrophosphatase [Candidatus Micrarchaeota archaeon]